MTATDVATASRPRAFDHKTVDASAFAHDLTDEQLHELIANRPPFHFPFDTVDTLSPLHPVGKGRTNLTLIMATIEQFDAATPYASFDMTATPSRKPIVSAHFTPGAYGYTGADSYVMSFAVQTYGPCGFHVAGYAGDGGFDSGVRTVNGSANVTVTLPHVPPDLPASAYIEQVSGGSWTWYQTTISRPWIIQPFPLPTA